MKNESKFFKGKINTSNRLLRQKAQHTIHSSAFVITFRDLRSQQTKDQLNHLNGKHPYAKKQREKNRPFFF